MILCLQMATRMNLCLSYENAEYALKIETDRAELFLALTIEF